MNNENYLRLSDAIGEAQESQEKLEALLHIIGDELKYTEESLDKEDYMELALKYPKIIKLLFITLDYSHSIAESLADIDKKLITCDQGGQI